MQNRLRLLFQQVFPPRKSEQAKATRPPLDQVQSHLFMIGFRASLLVASTRLFLLTCISWNTCAFPTTGRVTHIRANGNCTSRPADFASPATNWYPYCPQASPPTPPAIGSALFFEGVRGNPPGDTGGSAWLTLP